MSVATAQTSLYFVTSHATEPSKSLTREMGSVARRRAYSAGGSRPEARLKGKEGSSEIAIVRAEVVSRRLKVVLEDLCRPGVEIMERIVAEPVLARLDTHL